MAANPPPADLEAIGEQASSEPGPTEFWRSILPWDDLNAKSPPGRWLEFQKDIVPALAVMVAGRGPAGARLLPADAQGRLLTSAMSSFSDATVALAAGGGFAFNVADGTIYGVGQVVYFPDLGLGGPGFTQDFVARISGIGFSIPGGPAVLTVSPALPVDIPAGTPFIVLAPQPSTMPPAPWQAPRDGVAVFRGNVAAGGTQVLLNPPGTGRQRHYLFGMHMSCSVAPAQGNLLEDSTGVALFEGSMAQDVDHNFAGAPAAAGVGIRLHNVTAGIIFFTVSLGHSTA